MRNKKQPPNLTQLQHKLRQGCSPSDWNLAIIGNGAQKCAFVIEFPKKSYETETSKFVIKENSGGYRDGSKRPPNLQAYGIDTIYQIKAGDWIIQELAVKILADLPRNHTAWAKFLKMRNAGIDQDLHSHNFGIRDDDSLICFDW